MAKGRLLQRKSGDSFVALRQHLNAAAQSEVTTLVTRLLAAAPELDMKRWVAAVDMTADRVGFVMANGERPMTSTRYHVLRHLERVRHQFAIEVEKAHMPGFEAWALEVNGLVFTTNTAVRAPDGKVLVSPETGDPEPGAVVPYPEDARHRKAITEAELAERGLHVPAILPPVVSELEVELREPAEVVARAFALFACGA